MTTQKNGWKRVALIATAIIAIGGAGAILQPYVPWAPRVAFVWAAENMLARLDNQLITLMTLEAQAKATQDWEQARRLRVLINTKEREIKEVEKTKDQ